MVSEAPNPQWVRVGAIAQARLCDYSKVKQRSVTNPLFKN